MFKLVVLSAFFAVAAAKPGALFAGPVAYSTVIAPATTTITKQASSVVHPSPPVVYTSPIYAHFIKKRSVAALTPLAPATYIANTHVISPSLATTYSEHLVQGAHILPATAHLPYIATHFIKKRSAPLLPATYNYIAPTTYAAAAPHFISTYTAPTHLVTPSHFISSSLYTPHFIKKRSAPFVSTYTTIPTAYSHQSRVDFTHSSPLITTTYSAPITYSSPVAFSHVL